MVSYSNNKKDHLVIMDCPYQLVQIDKMEFFTIIQMGFLNWISRWLQDKVAHFQHIQFSLKVHKVVFK